MVSDVGMRTVFPAAGEWTLDPSWEESLVQCVDRAEAERSLGRLRHVVPPRQVPELTLQVPGARVHPLVYDYTFRNSRLEFIEFAVAVERFQPLRLRERFRNRFEYVGLRAELLAGLTISGTGARMQHEPFGRRGSGDWRASWPTGESLVLEVKCPQRSRRYASFEWMTMYFHLALMKLWRASPHVRSDAGTWIEIELEGEYVRRAASRGIVDHAGLPNEDAFEQLARAAMEHVEALPWPVPDGTYSLGRAGVITVRRDAGVEPAFHFGGGPILADAQHEARRVRGELETAATQLGRVAESGLVVLDTSCDATLWNQLGEVEGLLAQESWCDQLAGVLILGRRVHGTPDCVAVLVPGKRWQSAFPLLSAGTKCEHGHCHLHTGVFPPPPCSRPSLW